MGALSPLSLAPLGRRPILTRILAVYRLAPSVLAPLLPAGLEPRGLQGYAVGAACFTRLGAGRFFPGRATTSDHLVYRFAVLREHKDGPRPVTWVARRETSSWLEARCGAKILRGDYGRARFHVREDPFGLELEVESDRGGGFYLRAQTSGTVRDSLFPSPHALEAFFEHEGGVRPHDLFAPEADELDLDKSFAPEPLAVFEERSDFFSDPELFPPGSVRLDSAWRIVSRRLEMLPERARSRLATILETGRSSPALPTI